MRTHRIGAYVVLALITLLLVMGGGVATSLRAAEVSEIQTKIQAQNEKIRALEAEISQYERELEATTKEKQSLQTTVRQLDISRNKVLTDIKVTQNRIGTTDLTIEELGGEIRVTGEAIEQNRGAIAETLREINEIDSNTFIEELLLNETLSQAWDQVETLQRFQARVHEQVARLATLKVDLETKRSATEEKRRELVALRKQLSDQKAVLDANRREKDALLTTTKNQEANYQKLLSEKRELRAAFERELLELESELRITIDPNLLPITGTGVLKWPVQPVTITQYFGNTSFASQNPQIYNGRGHNGIDLRAPHGTPVLAALSGIVEGIGDTDRVCPNASYGKWILIRHGNGLSTLYAHLSVIGVSDGQSVGTGERVGYSGNSGYSTGPHLHFTVYATQGVSIRQLRSRVCHGVYTLPVADLKAYLNPLSYL